MKWKVRTVLVLSAHTDDMEIGAGATVRRFVESGAKVKSVVFSDCKESVDTSRYPVDILRKECKAAATHLGIEDLTILDFPVRHFPSKRQDILETIYSLRKETHYDLVLTSWQGDLHQDHRVVAEESLRAFMKQDTTVLSYPIPGNCPDFAPHLYVPVEAEAMQKKIDLLHNYESQVVRRGYFDETAIRGWMAHFGLYIGKPYAEAFMVHKVIIDDFKD
ncbi:MAG: PIG-L deacetylase family protein [Promethearchaeota archaeon]